MIKKMIQSGFFGLACASIIATALSFGVISCADDNIAQDSNSDNDKGTRVSFNVLDVQQEAITRSDGGLIAEMFSDDLVSQKLEVRNNAGLNVCLIESTVEGVNPVKPNPSTRANVLTAIDADFSTLGYRSENSNFITGAGSKWFYDEKTSKDGALYSTRRWDNNIPYARFYSVYPEVSSSNNKITLSDRDYNGVPYIDFEVETDVKDQTDLMTACSGNVHYAVHLTAPQVNLAFRHALTAVKFAIGQNLSWGKTIDKVELRNVQYKGRYTLPNDSNVTGTWSDIDNARTTVSLSGLSVSTSDNPNTVIMGENNDNDVFYMLPQTLTGNNVKAYFHFTDNTEIEVTLTGSWKAGTTKTYKLSQNTSNWEYKLEVTSPAMVAYNGTVTNWYTVRSYRQVGSEQQAIKWRVKEYSVDNGVTWTTTKPDWLVGLTAESGTGGTFAEIGTAALKAAEVVDLLELRNKSLKEATPKGTITNYYNLANQTNGGTIIENTANCYLISAPGYYRIPLVYGNAIKGGMENKSSYHTENTGTYILTTFKDHADNDITSPYINIQNSSNPARIASVVWADEANLITNPHVEGGLSSGFLKFEVSKENIKNGNAVIAVTNASGTVMWSWHLWFIQSSALETTEVTNFKNVKYNFTNETLGMKYTSWSGTRYTQPRSVIIKIEQEQGQVGNKETSTIIITQDSYSSGKRGYATLYQFGRKDALPGTNTVYPSTGYSFDNTFGGRSYGYAIQHPDNMFINSNVFGPYRWAWCNAAYYNTWSMNNTTTGYNDNPVIKTIYDPCPVGFKMPASHAFTGFTDTGRNTGNQSLFNITGAWDNGWIFNSKKKSEFPNPTIYFPALGYRRYNNGSLLNVDYVGSYWSAVPTGSSSGCGQEFNQLHVYPEVSFEISNSLAVRPVAE